MQLQSTPSQPSNRHTSTLLAWLIAIAGVVLLVLLMLSFMADSDSPPTTEVAGTTTNRVAYFTFGLNQDTLWLADPAAPDGREELFTVPHAAEYGVLPALSPSGTQVAYTALPPEIASPRPDSPASLWLSTLESGAQPRLLADNVDLLVAPTWTPDGASVIYRRTADGAYVLTTEAIDGGEERVLASSETEALFPVGFSADGSKLYYTGLGEENGSRLYEVVLAGGVPTALSTLSTGMTRDWALSPDGTKLAFLDIAFTDAEVASTAIVLDLASGTLTPVTGEDEVAFGPVWDNAGMLAVGTFNPTSGTAGLLTVDGKTRTTVDGPASGFDVPLAYNEGANAYLVQAFENDSITAPGRSALVLVQRDGTRETITEGEVTLAGWTHP